MGDSCEIIGTFLADTKAYDAGYAAGKRDAIQKAYEWIDNEFYANENYLGEGYDIMSASYEDMKELLKDFLEAMNK